ncbi:MAG: hypothetical protein IPJ85_11610 [Flavobacteriales bacterium]|nr:hypothetical protein [Flavobacteriales bacterium]
MIRPTGFGYDPETAASNEFQQRVPVDDVRRSAAEEFDALIEALRQCGVGFTVLDPIDPKAPNAVFPNNWFSTHADGTLVLYPMLTPSRRAERDPDWRACSRSKASLCAKRSTSVAGSITASSSKEPGASCSTD